jgi:hypothetical protein
MYFPWWFVGATIREDPIWSDMPEMLGHASIDFYLLDYRARHGYVDIMPPGIHGYHQYHLRTSIAPAGEAIQPVDTPALRTLEVTDGIPK